MIKYCFLLLIALIIGVNSAIKNPGTNQDHIVTSDHLIVPGKSVGLIGINNNLDSVILKQGKPSRQDAAMGATFLSWYKKEDSTEHKLQVFARNQANQNINRVKKIRITSPLYKTKELVGTGMSFTQISKVFKLVQSPNPPFKSQYQSMYNDLGNGISFEFNGNKMCSAIIVHAPGDNSITYINLDK